MQAVNKFSVGNTHKYLIVYVDEGLEAFSLAADSEYTGHPAQSSREDSSFEWSLGKMSYFDLLKSIAVVLAL